MLRLYILLFNLIIYFNCFSQNEANNWYFGQKAGVSFNTGTPVVVTGGQLSTLEGCSSLSDADGNLLFYTDGMKVWNKNHLPMLNTTPTINFLKGDPSSSQSGMIVPKPGSSTTFYIFTVDMQGGLNLFPFADVDGVSNGLMYSEVDMTADFGLGAVVIANKNISLSNPTTEGLTAVRDANGIDYWVVAHQINNNNYLAYHVTAAGVNTTPVISSSGPIVNVTAGFPHFGEGAAGYMKISPKGDKIAACHYRENKQIVISDFNASNGVINNSVYGDINLNSFSQGPYGVEFSNCSEYLYVAEDFTTFRPDSSASYPIESIIWRYNLNAPDVIASKDTFKRIPNEFVSALQLAPDGKIYCSRWRRIGSTTSNFRYGFGNSLHAINNPRLDTARFVNNAISFGASTYITSSGLPPFIASYFYISNISATNMVTGDTTLFCYGDNILFRGTTSAYDSIRWNFNDPGSGTINNTSVIKNPSHLFSSGGAFTITLIKYLCGKSDTAKKNIIITNYPIINDISDVTVCFGSSVILDATSNPVTSYLWSTGAVTPTITVDTTGKYSITANNNGCKSKDSMFFKEILAVSAAVSISSNSTNNICAGDNVSLTAIPEPGIPITGQSYQWYKNGSILTGDSSNTYTSNLINNSDIFEVVLTINNVGTCLVVGTTATNAFPITVKPIPSVDIPSNQSLCDGNNTLPVNFNSNISATDFIWSNDNTSIGLGTNGIGNIPVFVGSNASLISQTATITVTPTNNGCNGTSAFFTYTVNDCLLPVELIYFNGKKIEDFVNKLYWSTASEFNCDYFSLEYSQNIAEFEEIYQTKGAGISNQTKYYDFLHYDVPNGINFYRLKQVDFDGKFNYSDIIKIVNNTDNYLASIFPNPATNHISISILNSTGSGNIIIYDALGQVMYFQETSELKVQQIELDISHYANGIYYIKISDVKNKTTLPWIKQ